MLRFIVDTQLPPVLATYLGRIGHDAIHTSSFPDGQYLNDNEIIEIAKLERRIIITKDSDFFDKYFVTGKAYSTLYLKIGNIKNNDLVDLIQKHLDLVVKEFNNGAGLVVLVKDQLIAY